MSARKDDDVKLSEAFGIHPNSFRAVARKMDESMLVASATGGKLDKQWSVRIPKDVWQYFTRFPGLATQVLIAYARAHPKGPPE